ncbi:MAG TPA: PAS domain-containing protein [Clostridiales bacterium]|nr:PAS domain-containing protein [Clostridiales bacterium]
MFWMYYSLIILITFTCVLSITYLYLFKKNHEKYIGFWGFSWVIYTIALLFDIFLIKGFSFQAITLIKQTIYLFSSLLLLFGTYLFIRKKFPKIWTIFATLTFTWIGIGAILDFSFILITLPTSIFLGIISVFTGIMFLQYWQIEGTEKTITGVMFLVWGIHKTYYFYLNPNPYHSPLGYLSEIVLLIILNFCIFIIYLQKNRESLIQSERLFRLLAENSQDLIYLYRFRPSPRFEYVSPASKKITGYAPEEYYEDANLFTKLVHPEDRPLLDTLSRSKLSPKEPVTLRYLHTQRWILYLDRTAQYPHI